MHSPSPLPGPAVPPAATRIVAALTDRERNLFFPRDNGIEAAGWQFLADEDLARSNWAELVEQLRPTVLVTGWSTPALPEAWLRREDCPLRMVCHVTGSVRRLVPRVFLERGGVVTNWGETVSPQVAEHGLLLALAALRNAAQWRNFIARTASVRHIEELGTRTLFGRRVGLHGFGSVARALVPLLKPFGVSLTAYSAGVPTDVLRSLDVTPATSLEALFAGSDVLFECEALTPATELSVTAGLLAQLPDDAVFVNIGRGRLVDEAALHREAVTGRVRLALDVVAHEPLTMGSPFAGLPGVVLSPHIAGPTGDRYGECGTFALENLRSFLRGVNPAAAISLATYDRAT